MIDISDDIDAYIDDWGEDFLHTKRDLSNVNSPNEFVGGYAQVPSDNGTRYEVTITTKTAPATLKRDDIIKRVSDNSLYHVLDVDRTGSATFIRATTKTKDFIGQI